MKTSQQIKKNIISLCLVSAELQRNYFQFSSRVAVPWSIVGCCTRENSGRNWKVSLRLHVDVRVPILRKEHSSGPAK